MGVGRARRWWVMAAVAAVLSASSAGAQPAPPASPAGGMFEERLFAGVGLVHDNDNLPHPGNTLRDDNYSAAYELRVNGRVVEVLGLTAPLSGLDWLTRATRLHARGQRRFHSLQAIGIIYTPDRIQSAEVQLVAELARAPATIEQLLAMKAGDFIELDLGETVTVKSDGVPVFQCRYGTSNGRYAVRIQDVLSIPQQPA